MKEWLRALSEKLKIEGTMVTMVSTKTSVRKKEKKSAKTYFGSRVKHWDK